MKERPILFSSEMVKAILEGRKTMTRRIVNPQPQARVWPSGRVDKAVIQQDGYWYACDHRDASSHDTPYTLLKCPYGQPGDRLWVKEALRSEQCGLIFQHRAVYDADKAPVQHDGHDGVAWKWNCQYLNARFMPHWASRILLEVVSVRVERLQDISASDARAEGVFCPEAHYAQNGDTAPIAVFYDLWNSIYTKEPEKQWDANPWVWVIEFKRVQP